MGVLNFLSDILPALLVLYGAVSGVWIWVIRRASKGDVERIERRLDRLEQTYPLLPTREDTHLLRLQMMEMEGDLKTFAAQVSADRRQVVAELESSRALFSAEINNAQGLAKRLETNLRILLEHNLNHRT